MLLHAADGNTLIENMIRVVQPATSCLYMYFCDNYYIVIATYIYLKA